MTSDDSARRLGDATTGCDYNYENQWIEENFLLSWSYASMQETYGKC